MKPPYAGLPSHPGHKQAQKQQDGFGSMLSFCVHGGEPAAAALCTSLKLITHASSLGGVESLLERRAMYSTDAERGCPPDLLRISVGIEHVEDIWADLQCGLQAAQVHAAQKTL